MPARAIGEQAVKLRLQRPRTPNDAVRLSIGDDSLPGHGRGAAWRCSRTRDVVYRTAKRTADGGEGSEGLVMENGMSRRDVMKSGLAAAALGAAANFDWALPALAQGENARAVQRLARELQPQPGARSPLPRHPDDERPVHAQGSVLHDAALRPSGGRSGHVPTQGHGHGRSAASLSLDELRKMGNVELVAGFECSGNRRPLQGLIGNGRWTGVPLKTVLEKAGLKADAREIVFFGADKGEEEVEFRGQEFNVEQQYGRSLPRREGAGPRTVPRLRPQRRAADAASGSAAAPDRARLVRRAEREVAVADPRAGGSVPGQVPGPLVPHAQGRDDRRRDEVGRDRITHLQLKSFVARVTKDGSDHKVLGDRAERRHADQDGRDQGGRGPVAGRERAIRRPTRSTGGSSTPTLERRGGRASTRWSRGSPTPRAGAADREGARDKKTFLEDNSQHPRKVTIFVIW